MRNPFTGLFLELSRDPHHLEAMVSRQAKKDSNIPGPIMTFTDRPIFRPSQDLYWSSQQNFAWHREAVFK